MMILKALYQKALFYSGHLFALACLVGVLCYVPINKAAQDDDDSCGREEKSSPELAAKWSCTNGAGQTFYSKSPAQCAVFYPKCSRLANVPNVCRDPDFRKKEKKTCTKISTNTKTSTSTSTASSTSTAAYDFPALPGRVCAVDKFHQASHQLVLKKVDILFVMDHSQSMRDDWARVAQNIEHLVRQLPADANVRYGVLLADVGAWRGRLFSAHGLPAVLDNQTQGTERISHTLHKIFEEAQRVSDAGSGEASFYSLYHAVTTNAVANQKLGFFRPDAALSVIFMSDEQEIGFPFPNHADLATKGLPVRCDETFEEGIKREYYDKKGINLDLAFNAVKAFKGDMPVKAHAFINITNEDLYKRNSRNARCLYDSLGYGYKEIVEKTKGVLFSIQAEKSEGLARCGQAIKEGLEIQHDFSLSKPANLVDSATILAKVDSALVPHEYRAPSNSVYLSNAGSENSQIEIRHCEPIKVVSWNLSNFALAPAQYSVGVSWQTSEYATNGKVLWGTDANSLTNVLADVSKTTSHSLTVVGLAPNTVYYFQAQSWDEFGHERFSEVQTVRTLPDWAISNVIGQAARYSANVTWNTIQYPTKGRLLWGLTPDALSNQYEETAVMNAHSVELTGLNPDTVYYFRALSRDEFGLEKQSEVFSFRTQPDWGILGFAGTSTRSTVSLGFTTPDQASSAAVIWGTSATALNQQVVDPVQGTSHAVTINELAPNSDYYFQAVAHDGSGVEKRSSVILVHTLADWLINGFAGTSTPTSASVSWTTSGYATTGRVFWGTSDANLNNVVADTVVDLGHNLTVSGLNPDTIYYFQASSVDSDGVEKRSAVVAIRTQQIPLPNWTISGFAGTSTTSEVTLTWNTDQYATLGKVLWGTSSIALNGTVSETASGILHSVKVSGLAPDTIYYFQVVTSDDRGQEEASSVIAIRTMTDTTPPPTPATWSIVGFDGTTSATQANLIWQTPGVSTKATVYVGLSATDLSMMAQAVDTYATSQLISVTGLAPDTVYYFQVIAVDSAGHTVESPVISKRTKVQ